MLNEVHKELDRRFTRLRDSRSGPVFFIEHGLSESETKDLITDVSQALSVRSLESGWWQLHRLPLIIAATEVGYYYRGTGTDYWPKLETELAVQISAAGRQLIRTLFGNSAAAYRGAQPPDTPWARAFHLIAWPITHALVPLEFHRSFALTLANLSVNIADLSDENLHRAIRLAASQSSARFSTLLEDRSLVVTVARGLLGDNDIELSADILQRIKSDLEKDQVARRGVAAARRIQETTAGLKPAEPSPTSISKNVGWLELRRSGDVMSILAAFPSLQAALQLKLRRALRRHRYAPRLWGLSERIPSEQFLSGVPFPIKLTSLPTEDSELLPGLDEVVMEKELRAVLANFKLDGIPPLLFAVGSDGDRGWRVQGPNVSGHRHYWLLSASDSGPEGFPVLGKIGPYICHLLNPTEETARDALEKLGFHVRFGFTLELAGMPPFDRNAFVPVFAEEDKVFVIPHRGPQEGLRVGLEDEEVTLPYNDVVSLVVRDGIHTLRVSNAEETRDLAFCGTTSPPRSPPTTCSIAQRSDDLSVQALLEGTLSFTIDSFAPLEGLELTVEIEASDRRIYASSPLVHIPCIVASDQEPFKTLLDDKTRGLISNASTIVLRLNVGRLCSIAVPVERRVRSCWWTASGDGSVKLTSELGDLSFGVIPAAIPHQLPVRGNLAHDPHADLFAPVGLEASEYGGAASFTTFCTAPRTASIEVLSIKKPWLSRRVRGERGSVGVEDLFDAYLRWTLAETENLLAEFRRNQIADEIDGWISEICCGPLWRERELAIQQISPWQCLIDAAQQARLGRDAYVDLPESVWYRVIEVAIGQLRRQLPEIWELVRSPYDFGEQDWQVVETAFETAYKEVSAECRKKENERISETLMQADFTADNKPESWRTIFEEVIEQYELHALASLLFPTDTALGLVAIDASGLPLKELSQELESWVSHNRKALVAAPQGADLYAILALWSEPEVAVDLDWRAALSTLVADRGIARAARYLALRYRQPRQGI